MDYFGFGERPAQQVLVFSLLFLDDNIAKMMMKILDRAKHAAMIDLTKHGKDIGSRNLTVIKKYLILNNDIVGCAMICAARKEIEGTKISFSTYQQQPIK